MKPLYILHESNWQVSHPLIPQLKSDLFSFFAHTIQGINVVELTLYAGDNRQSVRLSDLSVRLAQFSLFEEAILQMCMAIDIPRHYAPVLAGLTRRWWDRRNEPEGTVHLHLAEEPGR